MINWLERVEGDRPFLYAVDAVYTYGEALAAVRSGAPTNAVFDLLRQIEVDRGLVVSTSGTTGPPKEVSLDVGNLEAAAMASREHLGHGSDDNWLLAMPLTHVGGMSIVVRQAYTGGSITWLPEFDDESAAEAMHGRVTMVSAVPTMLRRLIPHGPFSGLRAVLIGGGLIPPGLLEAAAEQGLPVLPTYGMTETFGQVATLKPGAPLAYGAHPLPGVDVEIRGGRIAIKSRQISAKALGDDGWLLTNDAGDLKDGLLRIHGRTDNVIISGGINVFPERIEAILQPLASEVAVVGQPDDDWGEMVVCLYVGADDIEGQARSLLEGPSRPKRFIRVDAIPKTEIGKPDRSALKELL